MGRRRKLPTEPFQARVSGLDADGRGEVVHGERRLGVFGALPGEDITARYRFGRTFRGQAEALEIRDAAPVRTVPRCPHFGSCGSCSLQHMDYTAQLEFKRQGLMSALDEAGGIAPARELPPLSAGPWSYRRKARLSVRDVPAKGRVLVGFREQDGRFVTDMRECHTLDERIARRLADLSELAGSLDVRARLPQIEACCGDQDCALVFRHLDPLGAPDLERLEAFQAATGLQVWLQAKGPDTLRPLLGEPSPLRYALPEESLEFRFGPLDFIQVNAGLNRAMVPLAMDLLDVRPDHRVLDLFCGLGNFTLPLARRSAQVVGLEGSAKLVEQAARNARANGLENARFLACDLYADGAAAAWPTGGFDRVLLDPPRSGAEQVLPLLAASGAERLLYVSCNPRTLARDAALLVAAHGYRLDAAGIMDMFPQTPHIESMALFDRA